MLLVLSSAVDEWRTRFLGNFFGVLIGSILSPLIVPNASRIPQLVR